MNFSDEEYVRLYVNDTVTWEMMGWEGNALLALALRKFDRSGIFEFGRHGAERALCAKTKLPMAIVKAGLEALLREEVWVLQQDRIFWPKYVDGQTCKRSDRLRQRLARARRAAEQDVTPDDECDDASDVSTTCDNESRNVTHNHEPTMVSQNVTLGEGMGDGKARQEGGAGGNAPVPIRPAISPAERQERSFRTADPLAVELFKAWQQESGKTGASYDWKRRELFERLASEGVTVEVVRQVVAGAKLDHWARDEQKLSPASILGSAEQREKYMELRMRPPTPEKRGGPEQVEVRLPRTAMNAALDFSPSKDASPTPTARQRSA